MTRAVLDLFLTFARYLSNLQNGVLLLKQLCDHILFNPAIWIHAPAKVPGTLWPALPLGRRPAVGPACCMVPFP